MDRRHTKEEGCLKSARPIRGASEGRNMVLFCELKRLKLQELPPASIKYFDSLRLTEPYAGER